MHERLTKQRRWLQIIQDSTRFLIAILIVSISTSEIYAVDLGKVGNTFRIEEEAFIAMMKRKLEEVDMEKERKKIEKMARDKIDSPTPVKGISAATEERTFYFDPTYILDKDVVLPNGTILHKAGTKVNPLEHMNLNRRLFFVDSRQQEQVQWLKEQLNNPLADQKELVEDRIILVGGSVFKLKEELNQKHAEKVFFDQHGELITKFTIKHSPAIAYQEGFKLRIDEINLQK